MRLLGVDYGLRKVGLALGDGETKVAVPLDIIEGGKGTPERIEAIVKAEGVDEVVVGIPVAEAHHSGDQQRITEAFIEELRALISVPIHTVDERFTTSESQRIQEETGSGVAEDALAAMLILESYFNELD